MEFLSVFSTLAFVLVFVLFAQYLSNWIIPLGLEKPGFFPPFVQQNSGLKISLQKILEGALGKSWISGASEYFCGNCSILNEIIKYLLSCWP